MKNNLLRFLLFLFSQYSFAQECGFDHLHKQLMQANTAYKNAVEKQDRYIYEKTKALEQNEKALTLCNGVYTIPVVVHVMHTGEAVGTGSNISDVQIEGAITGLNDFWRNSAGTGAADLEIQFELAKRDPNGNATTGIVRVNASSVPNYTTYGVSYDDNVCQGPTDTLIKALSYWPVSDYYNIWLVKSICNNVAAGWAHYPWGGWADGTTLLAASMTQSDVALAHELGHGFSLMHTFEGDNDGASCPIDNNCLLDGDQICDTPPHKRADCNISDPCTNIGIWDNSKKNYLSYCFVSPQRFTEDQKTRVQLSLAGNVRNSLLYSEALVPVNMPKEAGILSIDMPDAMVCNSTFSSVVQIKNYGTSTLTGISFLVYIDGIVQGTFPISMSIAPGQTSSVTIDNILVTSGSHTLEIAFLDINNAGLDYFAGNNRLCKTINFSVISDFPYCEDFETTIIPEEWIINNSDNYTTWELYTSTGCNSYNGTYSIVYDASTATSGSQTDEIVFPSFDLTNATQAVFNFRLAQKQTYFCNTYVTLNVETSTDCGESFTTLYSKNDAYTITNDCGGPNQCPCTQATAQPLYTTSGTNEPNNPWAPLLCNDWRNESINLNSLLGNKVVVKLKAIKADFAANDIYIDNICLNATLSTVDINDNNTVPQLTISPNPSSGSFIINLNAINPLGLTAFEIFNSLGQLIQSEQINNQSNTLRKQIELNVAKGIYTVRLSTNGNVYAEKLIVK